VNKNPFISFSFPFQFPAPEVLAVLLDRANPSLHALFVVVRDKHRAQQALTHSSNLVAEVAVDALHDSNVRLLFCFVVVLYWYCFVCVLLFA